MTAAASDGPHWRKPGSSMSNGQCVEVADCTCHGMLVRDSKDPDGPVLSFGRGEWNAFLASIRAAP